MLSVFDQPVPGRPGLSRRELLRVGGLSALGLSLSQPHAVLPAAQLAAAGGEASFGKAKACIVLFLLGGPPQHETWDPKPDAPTDVRGDFQPIASAVPGLAVGELMPRTATLTDRIAVLRAMSTADNAHSSSGYWMLTGYPHAPRNQENAKAGFPNNWPCLAAVVRRLSGDRNSLPGAVRLPEEIWNTGRIVWPGQDAGWLGNTADPWLLTCDPNEPGFEVPALALPGDVPPLRLDGRHSLLHSVNRHLDALDQRGAVNRWDGLRQKAFDLLRAPAARRAFDLAAEPDAVREWYGRNRFGQSVLLARRLVESGVRLVQVNWTRWKEDPDVAPAWDTHASNSERLKTVLMPPMDLAYSALLEDLEQRGMLDETLVVWMGEFGRTPKINARGGRDHWGHVFSVALAGGGVGGGVVHGASDRQGGYPVEGRVEPQDLTATIFHCLGYAPHTAVHDRLGRPMAITQGSPIREILPG
ncbi:MAG: DUF1501 domain-containing protein [Pirellulaceae bacterium]|nr:DUF1501 domain-containing protein [Pirellulaceae bacterium]